MSLSKYDDHCHKHYLSDYDMITRDYEGIGRFIKITSTDLDELTDSWKHCNHEIQQREKGETLMRASNAAQANLDLRPHRQPHLARLR